MEFPRTRRRMQEVNLTALIDIVFHLMVFVMLTTSFVVSESMELALPSAKGKTPLDLSQVMRIQLAPGSAISVEGVSVTLDRLNAMLASRLAEQPHTKIVIFTTAGVRVQQLVTVMDAVYLTGGHNVQVDKFVPEPVVESGA